jgi:hypothetical protein
LRAYVAALSRSFPDLARRDITPPDVRSAGLVTGKRSFLDAASPLFADIVIADRAEGTRHSSIYYDLAMRILFTAVSIDEYTSEGRARGRSSTTARRCWRLWISRGTQRIDARGDTPATAASGASRPHRSDRVRSLDELMAELDALVGMLEVKHRGQLVAAMLQVQKMRKERGLKTTTASRHLVFVGNPGTARPPGGPVAGADLPDARVVTKGPPRRDRRSGLVAGYVGNATKVQAVFRTGRSGRAVDRRGVLARSWW